MKKYINYVELSGKEVGVFVKENAMDRSFVVRSNSYDFETALIRMARISRMKTFLAFLKFSSFCRFRAFVLLFVVLIRKKKKFKNILFKNKFVSGIARVLFISKHLTRQARYLAFLRKKKKTNVQQRVNCYT